ncbi:MAG: ChaN family lipoprotein [Deltaproteobacteria bacterium]|nr:ChaN family lipoprotein [Deltaproteobacteria bacterium]
MRWVALISWIALIVLIGGGGCAGAARPEPKTAESIVREQEAPLKLVDSATGTEISMEMLLAQMRNKRVVYVGERHDRPEDHAVQYSLLRRLYGEDSSLAIGMEMFQVPFQEPLDQWSAGQIDETVLRRDTEYDQRWGFDFSMYRPILEYARSRGLEVVALNAPQEVAFAVAKDGVAELPEEVAATLPELDLDDPAHRALFDAEFDASQHDAGDEIEPYYEAQVVWDETMGARVAETLDRPDGPTRMIVFAGRVHVKRGLGIPERGARRGAEPYMVVLPVTQKELKAELKLPPEERSADFFWAVRQ